MKTRDSERLKRLKGGLWAVIETPLFDRVLLATYVITGLVLALALARASGIIDPRLWRVLAPLLQEGAKNTALFSVTMIPLGAALGFLLGWARFSRHAILSWPVAVYVNVVRGIPQLVLILFAFFWLPSVFPTVGSGLTFAVLALVIHTSAYQAEIFRAGFQSVARGQVEAAHAVGMTSGDVMRFVVLPQTFRVTLPALGNEFALIVKDSSLLAAIGAAELVYWGRNSAQFAFIEYGIVEWVFVTWIVVALLYFIITYIITQATAAIEHAFRVPGLGSVAF